jgi:hypothetical protein
MQLVIENNTESKLDKLKLKILLRLSEIDLQSRGRKGNSEDGN